MAENVHQGENVRHTIKASNFDVLVYNSWKGEVIRERRFRREFLFVPYDSWERQETPIDIQVTFSDAAGQVAGPFSPDQNSTGYRAIESWKWFVGFTQPNPPLQADQIVGIQIEYQFDGETKVVKEGVNHATRIGAGIVILVAIVVIAIVSYPLLVALAGFLGL